MKDNLDAVDSDIGVAEVVPLFREVQYRPSYFYLQVLWLDRELVFPSGQVQEQVKHLSCVLGMCYGILMAIITFLVFKIPNVFSSFTGYNTPEASKHRKHSLLCHYFPDGK